MSNLRKPYKTYTREFKLEALRLMEESGRRPSEIAMELGIRRNQLYKWKEQLIKKGEVTEKEGKEFIDGLLKKSEEAQKEIETKIYTMIQDSLKKMNLATKEDITRLNKKIARIEQGIKKEEK